MSDPVGKHLYANRAALEYHGVILDTFQSDDFRVPGLHPDDHPLGQIARRYVISLRSFGSWRALQGKDGEYRWFLIHSNPIHDEQGRVIRWFGIALDIDDRKQAEDALRLSEAYMAQAQQVACLGSWVYSPSGVREHLSDEFFRMYGFDPAREHPTGSKNCLRWQGIPRTDSE